MFNINEICRGCLSDCKDALRPLADVRELYTMCTQAEVVQLNNSVLVFRMCNFLPSFPPR